MRQLFAQTALLRTRQSILSILQPLSAFASAHHTALIWCLGIVYKFALDAMYVWAASPLYSYAGLTFSPSFFKYVVASAMYFILFALLPKRENDIACFLMHLQLAYTVAPMLSFYAFSGASSRYMLMVFLAVAIQACIVFAPAAERKPIHITGIKNYVTVALGVLGIFVLVVPVLYNGFAGIKAFDFRYIYEMRANAVYPPGFGYLQIWLTRAILPFALLTCLMKKRYVPAALCVAAQIIAYMESGTKFELFILVPILAIWLLSRTGHLLKLMYLGMTCICVLVLLSYQLDHVSGAAFGLNVSFIIGVRAIFHPADNKFNFYQYFSQHPKIHFSEGLLGKVFSLTDLYAGSVGQVSYAAEGGEFLAANMNTGYLGDSYAQMGLIGILSMAFLLALIVRALRTYNTPAAYPLLVSLFSIYFIILNDIALLTVLFTNGMLVAFLLVFIYLGKQEDSSNGIQRI